MSDARIEHIGGCLGVPDAGGISEAFANELLAELKQARAQLAEIGEKHEEFGYRYSNGDGDPDETGYDDEATARRIAMDDDTIMRRRVGDWEVVPNA
jgi:hypothetical protein